MLFNSLQYMLFLPIVVMILFLLPGKFRQLWLLAVSYYFYMCWNIKYIFIIVAITLITYMSGIILEHVDKPENKRVIVILGSVFSLLFVFILKYLNFFMENVRIMLGRMGIQMYDNQFDIMLPIGISFYTFQALGYVIDVYRGEKAEHNIIKYALFVSFFPQLASGPIERAGHMLKQFDGLANRKLWNLDRVKNGILLMLWGLFQKIVLADRLALYVDTVYGNYSEYGMITILMAVFLYAFQIYCDFDAYTNIARGSAQIIGIELNHNFNMPYLAENIKDFWARWHISLTSWFRDYLYIPLGGNRKGTLRKYLNILIVFAVSGLWHGASWNFVIWGLIHGLMLVIYNVFHQKCSRTEKSFSMRFRNIMATFLLVDLAWFFFRIPTLDMAIGIVKQMGRVLGDFSTTLTVLGEGDTHLLIIGLIILFVVDIVHSRGIQIRKWISTQEIWFRYVLYIGIICSCIYLGIHVTDMGNTQFIYFQF